MAVCHESAIEVVKSGQDCFRNPLTAEKKANALRDTRLQIPIPAKAAPRRVKEAGSGTEAPLYWVL